MKQKAKDIGLFRKWWYAFRHAEQVDSTERRQPSGLTINTKTMTPNQFRIGNLVKYDGRIFRLHSIGEYPILDTIEFGAKVVEWKDLEPVEITEEVLRGMGAHHKITTAQ